MTESEKLKHLEFIQTVVTRMNTNSFQIKGWMVTLVSACLALFASAKNDYLILVALFPSIVMWFLDAYYLMQERRFRALSNDVAGISESPVVLKPFEMRPDLYTGGRYSYWSCVFSHTIASLYLLVSVGLVGLFFLLRGSVEKGA